MRRRIGNGNPAILLLSLLLTVQGCHWGWHGGTTPPPAPSEREERAGDNTAADPHWLPPVESRQEPRQPVGDVGAGNAVGGDTTIDNTTVDNAVTSPPPVSRVDEAAPDAVRPADATRETAAPGTPENAVRSMQASAAGAGPVAAGREAAKRSAVKPKPPVTQHEIPAPPSKHAQGGPLPAWAKSPEELVYRVDFIGITMGYARFRYQGTASISGKPVYHLNVRAWTSGVLSYIFPINETIDYYLDAETIAPVRQEFTQREREKDDVALYDQETGKITYRYRQTGKIRKRVDTVPSVYDPVSVAYYFRWRDLGAENRPRNVYAGRKLYQISSRLLGKERIRTEHGEVDTIAVLPVIRRDGKPDNKGDLKIWFSSDERRVPVRLYAKFRKIKDWTLVGELMPAAGKTGG